MARIRFPKKDKKDNNSKKGKGVFFTKEFCLNFDRLNYREICWMCAYDKYSFDEYPCNECQIQRPSHYEVKRRKK